ncbi:MAG: hypothetical protein KGL48_03485 [Sphingomonadales bacterium]|nr:hypothetical protein [Sphingomonadales bacterium]MDE2567962.1 hypothetical protein [Sphingomonadales bacterium]
MSPLLRSVAFIVPVWAFALVALWIGFSRGGSPEGPLYTGVGALGVLIANVLMIFHQRICALEKRADKDDAS